MTVNFNRSNVFGEDIGASRKQPPTGSPTSKSDSVFVELVEWRDMRQTGSRSSTRAVGLEIVQQHPATPQQMRRVAMTMKSARHVQTARHWLHISI